MKNLVSLLIFSILLISCFKREVREQYPIGFSKENQQDKSKEYSKEKEIIEREILDKWLLKQKDSLNLTFNSANNGIWIRFIEKKSNKKVIKNNKVVYEYEIKNLNRELIYSFADIGKKTGEMGKFKEIRGVEAALYMMGKGDRAEVLLSSISAYSFYGDDNKISPNQPLILEIHLIDVD